MWAELEGGGEKAEVKLSRVAFQRFPACRRKAILLSVWEEGVQKDTNMVIVDTKTPHLAYLAAVDPHSGHSRLYLWPKVQAHSSGTCLLRL